MGYFCVDLSEECWIRMTSHGWLRASTIVAAFLAFKCEFTSSFWGRKLCFQDSCVGKNPLYWQVNLTEEQQGAMLVNGESSLFCVHILSGSRCTMFVTFWWHTYPALYPYPYKMGIRAWNSCEHSKSEELLGIKLLMKVFLSTNYCGVYLISELLDAP